MAVWRSVLHAVRRKVITIVVLKDIAHCRGVMLHIRRGPGEI